MPLIELVVLYIFLFEFGIYNVPITLCMVIGKTVRFGADIEHVCRIEKWIVLLSDLYLPLGVIHRVTNTDFMMRNLVSLCLALHSIITEKMALYCTYTILYTTIYQYEKELVNYKWNNYDCSDFKFVGATDFQVTPPPKLLNTGK